MDMAELREMILQAIKEKLREVAPEARAVLFGSRARGDARPDSDWDLLIILDKPKIEPADFDRIVFPLYELGWENGQLFSIRLYTGSSWEKRYFTPFYKRIEEEGITI